MDFIGFNSQILDKKLLNFYLVERFRYADAFFESILFTNGKFPLLSYHRERLYEACQAFHFDNYEINVAFLLDLIARNGGLDKTLRIRISLVRADGLNYKPNGSGVNVLIECSGVTSVFQEVETLSTYSEIKKQINPFSIFKTSNALLYVMAKKFALENTWNEVLICNENNHWIESSASNFYIIKNNSIYTSKMDSGCVSGVCRSFITNQFKIYYVDIDDQFLNEADEIFLSNGVNLIQPVFYFDNKQLSTEQTEKIVSKTKKLLAI